MTPKERNKASSSALRAGSHEEVLRLNVRLAEKLAWMYRKTAYAKGIDFDDVKQKALIILWYTIQAWEPERGNLSTIYHYNAHRDLTRYVNSRQHFNTFKQTRKPSGDNFLYTRFESTIPLSSVTNDYLPSSDVLERSALAEEVFDVVLGLDTPPERVASLLGHLEGHSYEEIAEDLGVSRMSAYNWCQETIALTKAAVCR